MEAFFVGFDGENVQLKKEEDGKVYKVELKKLSESDQAFVRKQSSGQ